MFDFNVPRSTRWKESAPCIVKYPKNRVLAVPTYRPGDPPITAALTVGRGTQVIRGDDLFGKLIKREDIQWNRVIEDAIASSYDCGVAGPGCKCEPHTRCEPKRSAEILTLHADACIQCELWPHLPMVLYEGCDFVILPPNGLGIRKFDPPP